MFRTYKEAYKYFYEKKNHFWDLGLENIKSFLSLLGSPENKLKIIQIAGTNGKGSTSAFLSSILVESGYKVGRYNSPVVFEERENITINNKIMSEENFIDQVNEMKEFIEKSEKDGKLPTVFELETAMAINYFFKNKCDIVILEAGLGGLTDATNVSATNIISIITSVSMDHMEYLGDTIEKIAEIKSGIIKKNSTVIIGSNIESVNNIMKTKAELENTDYIIINKLNIKDVLHNINEQIFNYNSSNKTIFNNIRLSMLGKFQSENASIAIEAACALRKKGYNISNNSIRIGLEKTIWKGRFEVISDNPMVILDGAHNPDAANRLKENIKIYLNDYNIVFIMGIFADKDYESIIHIMQPYMKKIVTVTTLNKRAFSAKEIKKIITTELSENSIEIKEAKDFKMALRYAKEMAEDSMREYNKKTAIIAFGSLSYLKYIRQEGLQK